MELEEAIERFNEIFTVLRRTRLLEGRTFLQAFPLDLKRVNEGLEALLPYAYCSPHRMINRNGKNGDRVIIDDINVYFAPPRTHEYNGKDRIPGTGYYVAVQVHSKENLAKVERVLKRTGLTPRKEKPGEYKGFMVYAALNSLLLTQPSLPVGDSAQTPVDRQGRTLNTSRL